jgi:hypothetical protein
MTRDQKRLLVMVIVPIQVFLAVFAWRDMSQRTAAQIRGTKRLWRVFVLMNPGNSLLYWLLGRRDGPRVITPDAIRS